MATTTASVEHQGFNIRWRYVIAVLIMLPVLAHLLFAVTRSPLTNYYMTVDELLAPSSSAISAGRIRVGAPVIPGSIRWDNGTRTMTFSLQGDTRPLAVVYRGFAPDSFRDGATVIVEGELGSGGTLTAYNLLVKCPHQYVPAL